MSETLRDVLTDIPLRIDVLDHGFVRLEECTPRLVPTGPGDCVCERAIVRCARISNTVYVEPAQTGSAAPVNAGSPQGEPAQRMSDAGLIRYLIRNYHTSPLECVQFTFHMRMPIFVAVHFLRHRTAKINQFSLRYAEAPADMMYRPSGTDSATASQSATNKQAREAGLVVDPEIDATRREVMRRAEDAAAALYDNYREMLGAGVAREVARSVLPAGQYTEMYYTMDLNNLLKLLQLRCDPHTQDETRRFAEAMRELIRPLVPVALAAFEDYHINALRLSAADIAAIAARLPELPRGGVSEKAEYRAKLARLGLSFAI